MYVCRGYLPKELYNLLGQILILLKKEKEELDDLSTELELADEDEKIQYRPYPRHPLEILANHRRRYKIGDAFFHVSLEQAQEMLEEATEKLEEESTELEEKLSSIREDMTKLKVELYARFGKQINLET